MIRKFSILAGALSLAMTLMCTPLAWAGSNEARLEARLGGDAVASGKAGYRDREKGSVLRQEFRVQVEDFKPGIKLEVTVDGRFIGTIVTDALGGGRIQLRTASFIDNDGDGDPIDPDFPRPHAGSMVKVGPLSGALE